MTTQIAIRLGDGELAALDVEVAEGRAALVQLDKRRPVLILTRQSAQPLLSWVAVAPITSTIRGLTNEVIVGMRNGLDHDSVVSCDNVTTVRQDAIGDTIGLFFDDQEPALARAVSDTFDLFL